MTPRITAAVALRVLTQIRRDHRTLAMLLVVPTLLIALLWWMYQDADVIFSARRSSPSSRSPSCSWSPA
jgi:ABC-2 type transport system permease protein